SRTRTPRALLANTRPSQQRASSTTHGPASRPSSAIVASLEVSVIVIRSIRRSPRERRDRRRHDAHLVRWLLTLFGPTLGMASDIRRPVIRRNRWGRAPP